MPRSGEMEYDNENGIAYRSKRAANGSVPVREQCINARNSSTPFYLYLFHFSVFREVDDIFNYMKKNYVSADSKKYDISRDIFHTVCGIIDVNALDVPFDRTELSALYPTFYLIEHSCLSNVKISFRKFKVKIRSAEKISRYS